MRAYDDNGSLVATVSSHRKPIKCVAAFQADTVCTAATGSMDGVVKLWKLQGDSWAETASCVGHAGTVESVAFSPNGQRVRAYHIVRNHVGVLLGREDLMLLPCFPSGVQWRMGRRHDVVGCCSRRQRRVKDRRLWI